MWERARPEGPRGTEDCHGMAITHISLGPIERYLQMLWERNGSDLLLTAYSKPLMRIDGQLHAASRTSRCSTRTTSSTSCSRA